MCTGCCGCFSAFRPRYKRLVDNIFPLNQQDGLVKANMEKLTFYSLSSPEKLDRIGEYMYQRAARDIYRKRYGFVIIAMEAMDQLLLACHAPALNLFVESYLRIVQRMLESAEPDLQVLATQSFVKFANIEEDTPSYHRRYDFFVSKFSAMCHSGEANINVRDSIRTAGIKGLQAVVRKTVSDDLVENIWEQVHMDKIVPSLLFNMQDSLIGQSSSPISGTSISMQRNDVDISINLGTNEEQCSPPMLAEMCFRELIGRASFRHIRAVLRPVLKHFDLHELWIPNTFAIHTFRIIIFSIQSQYSYTVIGTLMSHLDEHAKGSPAIRTSIAEVLSKIIATAAGESVGPTVMGIINSLLSHLRDSVKLGTSSMMEEEKQYQEALINTLGEFANHMPDYQKIEIMMFIMSKIPFPLSHNKQTSADNLLQSILLKSLLKVGTKYQTIHLNTTFPISFLEPLLRMSLAPDPEMRLLVQKIFHTLIDRHQNLNKLSKATVNVSTLELTVEPCSRPDLIFINKHDSVIYDTLYEGLQMDSNTTENIEAVYTTLALLIVEFISNETIIDLLQLILAIQNLALDQSVTIRQWQRFNMHAIVVSLLALLAWHSSLNALYEYIEKIIEVRLIEANYLLPELRQHYVGNCELPNKLPHLLVDQMAICEALTSAGLDGNKLYQSSTPYTRRSYQGTHGQRHSWLNYNQTGRPSVVDLSNTVGSMEVDSASSSPGIQRRLSGIDDLGLGFESMKQTLASATDNNDKRKELETERRKTIDHAFRTQPFTELVRRTQPKKDNLQVKLNDILKSLIDDEQEDTTEKNSRKPIYEQNFPELFLY